MEQKFKIGDVVGIKSGGISMTIASYNEENKTYYCQWFQVSDRIYGDNDTEKDQLAHTYFHQDTLEKR